MRKICLKIHRWLALPLGVFMAILCFSGLVLLIGGEIASAFDADPKQVPFLVAVKQLHRWLFMIPENPRGGLSVGRIITAVTTMCMTIVLLTGVVAWWPKSKKMLKNRLTVSTDKASAALSMTHTYHWASMPSYSCSSPLSPVLYSHSNGTNRACRDSSDRKPSRRR